MDVELRLPKAGDQTDALIVEWLKEVGDSVTLGEPIAEVETSKANMLIESPADGIISELVAAEGATVEVGDLLAIISSPS